MSFTDARSMPWTRILQLGEDVWLGIARESLFLGDYQGPKREVDLNNPIGLLPCLERPYGFIVADLLTKEAELQMQRGQLLDFVPLGAIPAAAVASRMDYWIQLALNWLAEIPVLPHANDVLNAISNETWATQPARHRAKRLLGRT